ncbi:MAG: DNA polymerase III subunit delta [Syntrophobacteraceae bacterium]
MQPETRSQIPAFDKIAPVYLFLGDLSFLADEAWKKLVAAANTGKVKSLGERVLAKETTAGQVIERLSTMPMFGPRKLFMVERVDAWGKEDKSAIEKFVPRIPPSACLVLTAPGKKGLEPLAKAVEAKGMIVQFRPLSERDAPKWLVERASERGKVLPLRAAFLLVEMTGADLHGLASELDKICTFVGDRNRIEAEDVIEAASSHRGSSMFELLDHVRARQADKALTSLRKLILSGEAPLKILSSLAWQLRLLWQVKDGLRQGLSDAELAGRLKMHPFAVKKAAAQAPHFSDSELHDIHEAIRQTDVAIKSTGSPPDLVLEGLILSLCLEKKKPSSSR